MNDYSVSVMFIRPDSVFVMISALQICNLILTCSLQQKLSHLSLTFGFTCYVSALYELTSTAHFTALCIQTLSQYYQT